MPKRKKEIKMQTLKIQTFASVSKTVEVKWKEWSADSVPTTGHTQPAHGLWINLDLKIGVTVELERMI